MIAPGTRHLAVVLFAATSAALGAGMALAATPPFDDLRQQPPIHGHAAAGAAKAAACAACHSGNAIAVNPEHPNLAGQSATYLYVQLRAFKNGARASAIMNPMASGLTDQEMRDLAAHFASLPGLGKPASSNTQTSSRGSTLFHQGDPAQGVPPCQGCHGVDGQGPRPDRTSTAPQPAWSTFPVLAGQNAQYELEQLKAYHDGKRDGTSNAKVMNGVAHNLSAADMQALADYVSSL